LNLTSHFGNVLHLWALPIVKREVKLIVNINIGDHEQGLFLHPSQAICWGKKLFACQKKMQ